MDEPVYFPSAAAFRVWLDHHAAAAPALVVGFYKVGTGLPRMTWPESVDEALCHGWIDGLRKRVDDARYTIRFTPRRPGSIWSRVNIERVAVLTAQCRMTPAGLAAFERRIERRSIVYAYEHVGEVPLPPAMEAQFRQDAAAWAWFQAQAPSWRHKTLRWVVSAKQPATRARRFLQLLGSARAGRRL